jgi:uncharacterized protein RhaS with RHS repeats
VLDNQERVVQELSSDGSLVSSITYDANGPETYTKDGKFYSYALDSCGNVVALTDETGSVVNSYSYDVWGQLQSSTETVFNPIRARGEYWDGETGFY